MAAPTKLNLKIYQGSTFKETLRWETSTKVYKPIIGITKAAPMVITAVAHGLPLGWRTKVTNVGGMKEINSADTYHVVTAVTTDTIELNTINSLAYTDYTSGGVLEYNQSYDLTGATAKMQIREKLTSTVVIEELTTENGKIAINTTDNTISILIDAASTALYTFNNAVYSMEIIEGTEVIPFIYGDITLAKEVTR